MEPIMAAAASFFVPGLGQALCDEPARGAGVFVGATVAAILITVLLTATIVGIIALPVVLPIIALVASYDAYNIAGKGMESPN